MNILTIEFWLIVIITTIGVNLVQNVRHKQIMVFLGSSVFCIMYSLKGYLILICFSAITYAVIMELAKNKIFSKKMLVTGYVCIAVGLLVYFKYLNFFLDETERIFDVSWNFRNVFIPLGVSFYVLSAIGYVLDIYNEKYKPEKNFLTNLIFLLYFPKLASGPIERGNLFFEKIKHWKTVDKAEMNAALQIILFGLIKKIVIADRLSVCVDAVFSFPDRYSAVSLLFAMVAYSLQIYCDFSGYTDIAIGISRMMGITLEKNFDLPYCANSPSDFWRRWHISLSSWFRDYIYIPLGGNREGKANRNIIITMLLSGVWHGANWTYMIWGGIHGVAQCIYRGSQRKFKSNTIIGIILNFIFVTCMWTIFRADSMLTALTIFKGVVTFQTGIQYFYIFVPVYFFVVLSFHIYEYVKFNKHFQYIIIDMKKTYHYAIITLEIIILLGLGYYGNTAFIYSQF